MTRVVVSNVNVLTAGHPLRPGESAKAGEPIRSIGRDAAGVPRRRRADHAGGDRGARHAVTQESAGCRTDTTAGVRLAGLLGNQIRLSRLPKPSSAPKPSPRGARGARSRCAARSAESLHGRSDQGCQAHRRGDSVETNRGSRILSLAGRCTSAHGLMAQAAQPPRRSSRAATSSAGSTAVERVVV